MAHTKHQLHSYQGEPFWSFRMTPSESISTTSSILSYSHERFHCLPSQLHDRPTFSPSQLHDQPIVLPCPVARSVYRAPKPSYMVSLSFFHADYMISLSCFPCKLHGQPIMLPCPVARSVYRAPHPSYMVSLSCSLPTPVSLNCLDPSHKLGSNVAGKVARRQTGLSLRPRVLCILPISWRSVMLRTVQAVYKDAWPSPASVPVPAFLASRRHDYQSEYCGFLDNWVWLGRRLAWL